MKSVLGKTKTEKAVIAWFLVAIASLFAWFFMQPPSLSAPLALFIWIFAGLIVIYLTKKKDFGETLKAWERYSAVALGIFFCMLSFFFIQLGLGNPPYSIDDYSILLSGVTLIFFALQGHRRLLFVSAIPLVGVISFQMTVVINNKQFS